MAPASGERLLTPSAEQCRLDARDVRVWAVPLDVPQDVFDRLSLLLAPDEQARARRFVFERDGTRFTAARGWLRTLLGACLGVDAAALRFAYSARGKPALAPASDRDLVHFNLAHSDGMAMVAVTRLGPVGVDVERLRPLQDADALVARFFSRRERERYETLPADGRVPAFFNLWTRKESLLKATGDGLGKPLHLVEVTFLPDEAPAIIAIDGRRDAGARWRIEHLSPQPGFVGALAIEQRDARVMIS